MSAASRVSITAISTSSLRSCDAFARPGPRIVQSTNETCDLAGEAAILGLKNGIYYGLDPVGARIWNLIQTPALANSVFIIVFDESLDADVVNGGGHVAMVMAGSHVKTGFKSTTLYQHQSTLRLVMDLLRVTDHPGNSATAPTMGEFFQ